MALATNQRVKVNLANPTIRVVHRQSQAVVGGVAAVAIGDPVVFLSVDAMHEGPQGGGPVIAIVDVGE